MSLVDEYREKGFVVVRGLYSPEEASAIKERTMEVLRDADALDEPSGVHVWMAEGLDESLRRVVTDPRIARIVRPLSGEEAEFLSVKSVYKNADLGFASPWHQDWYYWKGSTKLSAWIALDEATVANGCLRMIAGSHDQVRKMRSVRSESGFGLRTEDADLIGVEPIDVVASPGDVVFFHDLAVHGSHPNVSGEDRWSLIATYRDAGQVDESKIWSTGLPL